MSIKLPFAPSKALQATTAFLSAVGAAVTAFAHDSGIIPGSWQPAVTASLAGLAAVCGFIEKAEPIIDDITKLAD